MTASEVLLTVVIPAYNEGANLQAVIAETHRGLAAEPRITSFEIIIVNDGSNDTTAGVANSLILEYPFVRVVHHATNRGFGAALKTGFGQSRGRYVTLITADGEIGIDQAIGLFLGMGDADLMLSRRERTVNATRTVLTYGVNLVARLLLGFTPSAVTGIYVVRGDLLRSMELQSDTGLANLEVFIYCQHQDCKIRSGVMQVRPRLSGESKVTNVRTISRTFWEMFKLRLSLRRRGILARAVSR